MGYIIRGTALVVTVTKTISWSTRSIQPARRVRCLAGFVLESLLGGSI
jgi:hypothetical protein